MLSNPARSPAPGFPISEWALQAFADCSALAAIRVSPRGEILAANATFLRMLEIESPLTLTTRDFKSELLADPKEWTAWQQALEERCVVDLELALRTASGRTVVLKGDIWSIPASDDDAEHLLGVFADHTDIVQMRSALQHAARSDALASLASGIIHDFNNLLTVLVGNLYLVAEGVRNEPKLFEQTKRARNVAKRGVDLSRQLLSFSSNDRIEPTTLDARKLVSDLQPMLRHALGSRITLIIEVPDEPACIDASAAQLESAVVNLAINARDAIDGTGTIEIAVETCSADEPRSKGPALAPGDYVCVSVKDSGVGIPDALRDRIFEPFFSTKGKNRGTGLGLTMVRWFVEHLGGALDVSSGAGAGTTISLFLPASRGKPEDSAVLTMPLKTLPTGDESILVIADDAAIAKTVEESLAVLGYGTHVGNPQAELSDLLAQADFSMVILDSSARSALEQLREPRPSNGLPGSMSVLIISEPGLEWPNDDVEVQMLRKPFVLKDLAITVRTVLDRHDD